MDYADKQRQTITQELNYLFNSRRERAQAELERQLAEDPYMANAALIFNRVFSDDLIDYAANALLEELKDLLWKR